MGEKWIDKMHCSFNSYRKISMKPTNKCRINKTGEFFKNNPMFQPRLSVFSNSPSEFTPKSAMLLRILFHVFFFYLDVETKSKISTSSTQSVLYIHAAFRCQITGPPKACAAHVPQKIEALQQYSWDTSRRREWLSLRVRNQEGGAEFRLSRTEWRLRTGARSGPS